MHEERVLLREIHRDGILGSHGIAGRIVILTVVACQHVLVHRIGHDHIPVGIVGAGLGIVEDAVAYQRTPLVVDDRTSEELRLFCACVIIAVFTVDDAIAGVNL